MRREHEQRRRERHTDDHRQQDVSADGRPQRRRSDRHNGRACRCRGEQRRRLCVSGPGQAAELDAGGGCGHGGQDERRDRRQPSDGAADNNDQDERAQ